jgi:phosphomannomutase
MAGKGQKVELIDGVKIHFVDGWVLVLPDANEAYCHVWAEAKTEDRVKHYLDEYSRKIEEWQKLDESDIEKKLAQKPEAHQKKAGA